MYKWPTLQSFCVCVCMCVMFTSKLIISRCFCIKFTTDASHCQWFRVVQNIQYCPYSCKLPCQLYGPFVPCEFFQFRLLADASLWLVDFGTKSWPAFQSIAVMTRIRLVRQCSSIAFHGIFSPMTVIEPIFECRRGRDREKKSKIKQIVIRFSDINKLKHLV